MPLRKLTVLYTNNTAFVKVNNDVNTNWFDVPNGVRQGDPLSPNLFNIFINELVKYLKSLKIGIDIEHDLKISVLLYADDIILLGSDEAELQSLLLSFGPTIMVQYVGT